VSEGTPGVAFWFAFWARLGLVAAWVGVPALLVAALVWWTTRGEVSDQTRRARSARLIGLGVGALVGALMVWAAVAWLGPVAVAAGYLSGVVRGELRDAPPPTGDVRVASLRARTTRRYVPRWAMLVAVGAAVSTMLAPAVFASVPAARFGPWHPVPADPLITLPGATLTWPSATLWIPLALIAGAALVVGALLIRRTIQLPAATPDRSGVPESTRRNAARAITGTVAGVELVTLGALAVFASGGLAVPASVGGGAYLGSRILVWTGLGLGLTGVLVWCVLSRWRRGPSGPDSPSVLPALPSP
jgi:hypothetical protein